MKQPSSYIRRLPLRFRRLLASSSSSAPPNTRPEPSHAIRRARADPSKHKRVRVGRDVRAPPAPPPTSTLTTQTQTQTQPLSTAETLVLKRNEPFYTRYVVPLLGLNVLCTASFCAVILHANPTDRSSITDDPTTTTTTTTTTSTTTAGTTTATRSSSSSSSSSRGGRGQEHDPATSAFEHPVVVPPSPATIPDQTIQDGTPFIRSLVVAGFASAACISLLSVVSRILTRRIVEIRVTPSAAVRLYVRSLAQFGRLTLAREFPPSQLAVSLKRLRAAAAVATAATANRSTRSPSTPSKSPAVIRFAPAADLEDIYTISVEELALIDATSIERVTVDWPDDPSAPIIN